MTESAVEYGEDEDKVVAWKTHGIYKVFTIGRQSHAWENLLAEITRDCQGI